MKKKKRFIAIALALLFSPVLLPKTAKAQTGVWEIPCIASGVCAAIGSVVVGGVAYIILQNRQTGKTWRFDERNLQNHNQPIVQPGPRSGAFYAQERHGAVRASDCNKMAARFKRAGRRVRLARVIPNDVGVGGVLRVVCIFEGEDAQEGWYSN